MGLHASDPTATAHPLSHGQRALWFLQQLDPHSTAYNVARALRLRTPLNATAFRATWQALVDRHAALRTTFADSDAGPVQIIHPHRTVDFTLADASAWTPQQLEAHLAAETYRPFDLANDSLLRVRVYQRAPDDALILFVLHHIICDLWSLTLMLLEVPQLYQAALNGTPAALRPLRRQYTDFVTTRVEMLAGPEGERLWGYWRERLAGELPVLDLPTDRPRLAAQTDRAAVHAHTFSAALTAQLRSLAEAHNASLQTLVTTAFQVLLHRYTGQSEIIVGAPRAGRSASLAGVMGYFVNSVPLRADLAGDPTFADLLTRTGPMFEQDFAHGAFPFPLTVERLQPARDLSRSPLVQVMLAWQKTTRLADWQAIAAINAGEAGVRFESGGLQLESVDFPHRVSVFELTLQIIETADGLSAVLEYNTHLFEAATAARMLRHFEALLAGIAATPHQRLSQLPLLAEAERHHLLTAWNQTRADYPREKTVTRLIAEQAARTPEAAALLGRTVLAQGEVALTYAELEARSNQLAHYLRTLGVSTGALVGLALDRTVEMVVAVLGTLKAGAAYLPLDPAFPRERLAFMLADAQPAVLLTQEALRRSLPPTSARVICLDRDAHAIAQSLGISLQASPSSQDLAYLLYTSGSTGQPKGVQIPHSALVNCLLSMQREPGLSAADRLLAITTLSFDIAALELLLPLITGGTVILAEREVVMNGVLLARRLAECGATVMQATPATWRMLLESGWRGTPGLKMLCGGEALTRELADSLLQRGASLWNLYGPTETTIWSAVAEVKRDGAPISLGRPIANTQLLVLDAHRQPVPFGVVGELYIGGQGVARGYHNRPELTAERFVRTGESGNPPLTYYRTGDLVRRRADGTLEFVGRADTQVKVRGFRVELGEVEAVLLQHPTVRQAVVTARPARAGDTQLVAYVVTDLSAPTASELQSFLRDRLPAYMLPAAFVPLEALPLTPNGKVDRRALPAPGVTLPTEMVAPRTSVEATLARLWAEVLGLEAVGVHDNFFELGGHSLLATQVASRLRTTFHVELPLRTLFEAQTIEALAIEVERARHAARVIAPPLLRAPRNGRLPLSFSQERMWFIQQLEPDNAAYNVPGLIRLCGALNTEAVTRSLQALVHRHESLRTTFEVMDGQPVQRIAAEAVPALAHVDLRGTPPAEREAAALRLAEREAAAPFDLTCGPLFRVTLLQLAEADHCLVFNLHHTVSDAWSLRVLLTELMRLYEAEVSGRTAGLPDLPIQYADYAVWQREWLQGATLDTQMSYWREQLRDLARLELPTDHPRPARQTYRGSSVAVELPDSVLAPLRTLSHAEGASLFMTLFAAFVTVLHRYTGQMDIAVGTPIANRTTLASEHIIGSLVNTLVLRVDLDGEPAFRELLRRVREAALAAYAHQDLPFAKLVAELAPERDLSYSPLVQVMFNLINVPMPQPHLPGLKLEFPELDRGAAQFDLTLTVVDLPMVRRAALEYNTDLFERVTMERLLGHFTTVLAALAAHADRPVAALPMLTAAERQQLLAEWNATRQPYPLNRGLQHAFEAQVERAPDAVAVIANEQRLTFAEVNARANQVAQYLRALGVDRGALVAVCLERSTELIVALFGILKAGGAYVPLDPTYPKDRLAYMLADSRAPVLLTQQSLLRLLPTGAVQTVCLDTEWPRIAQAPVLKPQSSTTGDDLAYVIYTSGSTGQPKGVQAPHRGALNRCEWMWEAYPFTPDDVCVQKTALSFVDSVWEIFGPLLAGVPLVVASEAVARDPVRLVKLMARERVTRIVLVPSLLKALLETHPDLTAHWPSLRLCVSSGEALSQELARRFFAAKPGAVLLNLYGSSEAAGDSLYYEARAEAAGSIVPIGRPIANTQVYLLDAHGQPVPLGVRGEICIGGAGLARGYLNRPELTAEKFVTGNWLLDSQSPITHHPPLRLYKTGDLGVYRADGVIEYAGRRDFQVKIRGFRIELGELEATLRQQPQVREVVVVARPDLRGEPQLVAYCVPQPGQSPSASDVRDFLRGRLPAFMLPAACVFLERLPLTPNGKVDRKALPAPDGELKSDRAYIAPRNLIQSQLAQVWEQVLGVRPISVTESFFDLGGHSLLAVRLFAEIETLTGRQLPVASLFESPTIEAQAQLLQQAGWSPSWSPLITIQGGGERPPFYCVHEFDGNAFYYRDLAQHLGPAQPFYGLQARGLDGQTAPHTRIEDMAAEYVEEIIRFQPNGPYYLGGSSLGGLVAFEMARRLQALGHPVGVLALFDTWCPGYSRLLQLPFGVRVSRHLSQITELGLSQWMSARTRPRLEATPWFKDRAEAERRWRAHRQAQATAPLPPDLRDFQLRATLSTAASLYHPQPYAGKVTFFSAAERPAQYYHDPRLSRAYLREAGFVSERDVERVWRDVYPLSWEALAGGGLDVIEVTGPHGFMVRAPHVRALAQALKSCLEAAYAAESSTA